MSDYIKREDAIFIALQQPIYSLVSEIKQLDGIDIVRCKECLWYKDYDGCFFSTAEVETNGYCSLGERKSNE